MMMMMMTERKKFPHDNHLKNVSKLFEHELYIFIFGCLVKCGPGSSGGTATRYGLERSRDRIPVGVRFSVPVQTDPGAHPASCTMGTGSFPGVKWSGRGVDRPPRSSAEVKERVELLPLWPSWPVLG